jgi:hypothetical protein
VRAVSATPLSDCIGLSSPVRLQPRPSSHDTWIPSHTAITPSSVHCTHDSHRFVRPHPPIAAVLLSASHPGSGEPARPRRPTRNPYRRVAAACAAASCSWGARHSRGGSTRPSGCYCHGRPGPARFCPVLSCPVSSCPVQPALPVHVAFRAPLHQRNLNLTHLAFSPISAPSLPAIVPARDSSSRAQADPAVLSVL